MTSKPIVLVTHTPRDESRRAVEETLGDVADIRYWTELEDEARDETLRDAKALMSYYPHQDLGGIAPLEQLGNCELIQCLTAGVDFIPLGDMPSHIPIAYNAGAYAKPMAEHVVAMALAAAKRLAEEHRQMQAGEFRQFVPTKAIAGTTCGILGYGETGREIARLMRALGVRIQAVNRSGRTDEEVDFIGTLDDIDRVLVASDILVITLSLTARTNGLIGADRLALMKPDAILVNVARGEIVDEDALYHHLVANPEFVAALEAWWIEPVRHGRFEMKHPFLDLPNVIASPHNSAMTEGAIGDAVRRAAVNVRRLVTGEAPRFVAGEDDRLN